MDMKCTLNYRRAQFKSVLNGSCICLFFSIVTFDFMVGLNCGAVVFAYELCGFNSCSSAMHDDILFSQTV